MRTSFSTSHAQQRHNSIRKPFDEGSQEELGGARWFKGYMEAIHRWYYVAFLVWSLLGAVGGIWGVHGFLSSVDLQFDPPSDSRAFAADKAMIDSGFKNIMSSNPPYILLIERKNGTNVLGPDVQAYSLKINASLYDFRDQKLLPKNRYKKYLEKEWLNYVTYYSSTYAEDLFLSENKKATFFTAGLSTVIDIPEQKAKAMNDLLLTWLQKEISRHAPPELSVRLTGLTVFEHDIIGGVHDSLENMEKFALPLALFILTVVLRSIRMTIIPLINIGVTLAVSFLIMWPISKMTSVASFAPSIMTSVALAMSIDYSLFLLSRYKEELDHGSSPRRAVHRMVSDFSLSLSTRVPLCDFAFDFHAYSPSIVFLIEHTFLFDLQFFLHLIIPFISLFSNLYLIVTPHLKTSDHSSHLF